MSGGSQDAKEDAILQQIVSLARVPAGRRGPLHSPLYEWLWARSDTLAAELNPPRTPNWKAIAEGFAKAGVVDGKGQAPTPVVVRKTWLKVHRAKETVTSGELPLRRKGKPSAVGSQRVAGQSHPPLPTPASAASAISNGMLPPGIEPPEEPPTYTFKFAKAKDWTKVTDKGDQ